MPSGAISTQLCSSWRKVRVLKISDKNMWCNILRNSAAAGSGEDKDLQAAELSTAGKQYHIQNK